VTVHHVFRRIDHRPFPLPTAPWVGRQSWRDLLFIHWPVPAVTLQSLVPRALRVQEFDGTSWVGLVPFRMYDVAPRGTPALPWLSAFPELNLRLYVEYRGRPGVWFISLDASRTLAVWAAKTFAHLPYFKAHMKIDRSDEEVVYSSSRRGRTTVEFRGRYRPTGPPAEARRGTLEYFLTERYALFSRDTHGRLWTIDVHHLPWPLQSAEADLQINTIASAQGLPATDDRPLLHFSLRQDVATWAPKLLGSADSS
jgi:uncharacterized protein YqjF (DUF2071 family)